MFNELKDTFAKLHKLAWEARQAHGHGEVTISEIADLLEAEEDSEDEALFSFLNELDFETVKIIQTIMLLGREQKENERDTPEEAYKKMRQGLDRQGWNEKEVEIYYIIEKAPLYQYLKSGFEVLNISL